MKKSLLSVFTMVAMAAAFTACSNDDIEVPDVKNGEARSVFMKLELPTLTRSTEPPVASGTVATVSNLHVYFHDGTSILKYVNATTTTPITIANLTTGTQITDVPAAATTVTVCGNIPAGTSLPTGGTVAALKAVQLEITSQSAVADVVLMYAEAKIELGEIDATVLACINDVRARAYGTTRTQTNDYPSITTTDQTALRKVLRRERRVEFAWENLRYFDLLRWHQFENAFGHNMYGFTRTANRAKEYFAAGNWFWPETPTFDKDGFPSFEAMADGTYIVQHGERKYDEKIYLWPLPSDDVLIMNGKLVQNPGY